MLIKKYDTRADSLLKWLSDGELHSVRRLSQRLNISLNALRDKIQSFKKKGLDIQSGYVNNETVYQIPNGLNLLDPKIIASQLDKNIRNQLSELHCLNCIDSTNDYLLKQQHQPQGLGLACFAEQQTAGRGRSNDRVWHSPYANNIYHSLRWYFDKRSHSALGLSLAVAIMVMRVLNTMGIQKKIRLKWPNDVLWNSKKLSGILIDTQRISDRYDVIIIGIGINTRLNHKKSTQYKAISTEEILHQSTDRNLLAARLLNELIPGLQTFELNGLSPFMKEWEAADALRGKQIQLNTNQKTITGTVQGISQQGALLLEETGGKLNAYLSGETKHLLSFQKENIN